MSETLYTYKRVRRPDGVMTYERVPYNSDDPVLEPPVLVPQFAPLFKNGEQPFGGSAVLDRLVANTNAANAQRTYRDALDAHLEREEAKARLSGTHKTEAPQKAVKAFRRLLEP